MFNRHSLNATILAMAPAYEAKPVAPSTFAELIRAPRLVVWDGESERTIYRDAKVNHAARAWHDAGHIATGQGFTLEGERAVARYQIKALLTRFPGAPQWLQSVIWREVAGQAEHYETHGAFPVDQEAWHALAV